MANLGKEITHQINKANLSYKDTQFIKKLEYDEKMIKQMADNMMINSEAQRSLMERTNCQLAHNLLDQTLLHTMQQDRNQDYLRFTSEAAKIYFETVRNLEYSTVKQNKK
jgi:hypothetical protein